MDEFKKYDEECAKIRETNARLLEGFEASLTASGLSEATVGRHVSNVDFYINDFLLYYEATEARGGSHAVGMFLGDWFIRKAGWASEANVKSTAASLKNFTHSWMPRDCSTKMT